MLKIYRNRSIKTENGVFLLYHAKYHITRYTYIDMDENQQVSTIDTGVSSPPVVPSQTEQTPQSSPEKNTPKNYVRFAVWGLILYAIALYGFVGYSYYQNTISNKQQKRVLEQLPDKPHIPPSPIREQSSDSASFNTVSRKFATTLPLVTIAKMVGKTSSTASPSGSITFPVALPIDPLEDYVAYTFDSRTVIGPKNWQVDGKIEANGDKTIHIYKTSPYEWPNPSIGIYEPKMGTMQVPLAAVKFFSYVQKHWNSFLTPVTLSDWLESDSGYTVASHSSHLVTFTKPVDAQNEIQGAAYSDIEDHMNDTSWKYIEMRIIFPITDRQKAQNLIDTFILQNDFQNE